MRHSLQHDVFDAPLAADALLLRRAAVLVHHEHIRLHDVQRRQEIQHTAARIDVRILHIANALDHEQPLLLAVDSLVVLISQNRSVAADAHIQIAELSRLPEELHMAAVQQIVASRNENFLCHNVQNALTEITDNSANRLRKTEENI